MRFGASGGPAPVYHAATMLATAPRTVRAALATRQSYFAALAATVGLAVRPVLTTAHDNAVNRAPQAWLASPWAPAAARASATGVAHAAAARREHRAVAGFLPGTSRRGEVAGRWEWMLHHARPQAGLPWTAARAAGTHVDSGFAELVRTPRPMASAPWGQARPLRAAVSDGWITLFRTRRPELVAPWGDGQRTVTLLGTDFESGRAIHIARTIPWEEARRPPPGVSVFVVVPPARPPCYNPLPGDPVILRFQDLATVAADLRFRCPNWTPPGGGTVVIPIRRIYMQTNTISVVIADTGQPIVSRNLRLSLDADSWVWGWSAVVNADHLAVLSPSGGQVELLATINGTAFRLAVERIRRERTFGKAALSISGRGRAAWLADPYADIVTRTNAEARTAQQLMADALTENGISLGWALDWQITDWLVPAGAWSHTGTAMEACLAIASAAGAYIQAHRTDQRLAVLPRYPSVPWSWGSVTPDIQIPEDVCVTEGIEWVDKPAYNTVFVSGQDGGILAHVTRGGTAGDKPAPMITDALTTHADAGRQRGISILSDTGRQKLISLSLPVLPETGIIVPGKFVRYTEGGTQHIGLTRAVEVGPEFPKLRQTITVESHVI